MCLFPSLRVLINVLYLLGVHLGIDEVLPGTKTGGRGAGARSESNREKTASEKFAGLLEMRSVYWHERRHRHAQAFLDKFVRQNIAEIDEIPYQEHEIEIELPPAERAIYLELETHLKSLEMNKQKAVKCKKNSKGDRDKRMQQVSFYCLLYIIKMTLKKAQDFISYGICIRPFLHLFRFWKKVQMRKKLY